VRMRAAAAVLRMELLPAEVKRPVVTKPAGKASTAAKSTGMKSTVRN